MEWIKIEDRKPNIHDRILVFDGKTIYTVIFHKYGYLEVYSCVCDCFEGSNIINPTHWMPLPEKPKIS